MEGRDERVAVTGGPRAVENSDAGLTAEKEVDAAIQPVATTTTTETTTEPTTDVANDDAAEWTPGVQEKLIMFSLSFISLMVALDATILVPALPTLAKSLHGTATQTFWAGTSYLLTNCTFQPVLTALSDIFGRREMLMVAILMFTVGTIMACVSHDFQLLLAGRSIQGVGGGGIIALGLVIFTDIIPLRQRAKWNGLIQFAWAVGTVAGPLVGGAIAQHTTWRWIFYINFPFCGIGLAIVPLVVKLQKKRLSFAKSIVAIDWIGSFLFIGSTTSFLVGLSFGGNQYPWRSANVLVPLLLGLAAFGATLLWEARFTRNPFVRISLFQSRSGLLAYMCSMIQGLLLYIILYYVSLYFLAVKHRSPTATGVAILPLSLGVMPASIAVGVAITRFGYFRWSIWSGWAVSTLGFGLLILFDVTISTAAWVIILIVLGLGMGMLLSSLNFAIQAIASNEDVAYASSMYTFVRGVGMTLGVAIGGVIFQNKLSALLPEFPGIAQDAEAWIAENRTALLPLAEQGKVLDAFAKSFQYLFEIMTGICGGAGILSLGIAHHSLDKKLDSEHKLGSRKRNESVESPQDVKEG